MRENIGKIQIPCNPVDGDASDAVRSDSFFDDPLKLRTVRSNPENPVPDSSVKFYPVYPVLSEVNVDMEDVMA